MHVAIVGAGALGSVYGAFLARREGVTVSFVVRPSRIAESAPIRVQRAGRDASAAVDSFAADRVSTIPGDADVVLVAVGTEDLDAMTALLGGSEIPIIVLTPMMPREWNAMRGAFGSRVLAAMPNVVSYANDDGVVRYWLAPAPTRIDEPRAGDHGVVVRALVQELEAAGLTTHLELGVHETNPASTVCFIPLGMAVVLSGGTAALPDDPELLELVRRCCREGVAMSRRIGRPEPLVTLAPLVATPLVLKVLVSYLRRREPEVVAYIDRHFGHKLVQQHRDMAHAIVSLAASRGVPREGVAGYSELARRLDAFVASMN